MSSASSSSSAAGPAGSGSPLGLHPSAILSAYLEPLVRGRRVAVLGDAGIGLAERLVERGARLVLVYDPDAARVAEALARIAPSRQPHPSFAVLEGDLGVRDGAFDAVILPDLTLFPDPAEVLRRARRLVSDGGAAVIASPNPEASRSLVAVAPADPTPAATTATAAHVTAGDGRRAAPDYYTLYDLVSLQFRVVRMLGQAPFVGYTVADFAQDGEPEVSFDTSLIEASEEPEWFIALASERPVRLDPFAVVELPFAELSAVGWSEGAPAATLARAEARAAALDVEITELRARQERKREAEEAKADAAASASARIAEVETELAEAEARFKEVEARAGDAHVRAERSGYRIRDLEEELRSQRERAARLAKQLDDEKKARTKVELELGMIRNKPEIAGAKDRIDALGAELEAARARVVELEARPITPPKAAPDPALMLRVEELEAAIVTAKREIARLTGERDGARSRIEELGRALEEPRRAAEEQRSLTEVLQGRIAEITARRDELQQRNDELTRQLAEAQRSDANTALAGEIAALEAALRERGQVITALQAELRESERVGKELVDELGHLFEGSAQGSPPGRSGQKEPYDGPGQPPPSGGAESPAPAQGESAEGLRRQLNTLAQSAARYEADLHAAAWRIARLERELADVHDKTAPASVHDELERALAAAQAEVAALRRAAAGARNTDERSPPRADAGTRDADPVPGVLEQAVLLHQVASAAP